jgi:hypothetical protein
VGLVVRCPIGRSTKVTVPAWRLDRRRSVSMDSTNLPLFIQALADLLLEAAGVGSIQMTGGDHEYQDHT